MTEEAAWINADGVNYLVNGAGNVGLVCEEKQINSDPHIQLNIKIKPWWITDSY